MDVSVPSGQKERYVESLRELGLRLRDTGRQLVTARRELQTCQDMLAQSQSQFAALDRKYTKARKCLKEYQTREAELLHQEEFYLSLLQEKDTEYNALLKTLKDRVSKNIWKCKVRIQF